MSECKYCGYDAARQTDEDCPDNPANKKQTLAELCDEVTHDLFYPDMTPPCTTWEKHGWPIAGIPKNACSGCVKEAVLKVLNKLKDSL